MFRDEYQQYVIKTLLYWHTKYLIVREVSWRNNDYHLLDPSFANFNVPTKTSLEISDPIDVSLDLATQNTPEQIQDAKFRVFKFAVQFYYTILQRSHQKFGLPDVSRYLKAYINEDVRCAQWFVHEFVNAETLKEIMMQNC